MASLARRSTLTPFRPSWLVPFTWIISSLGSVMGSPVTGWVTVYQTRPSRSRHGSTSRQGTGISSRGRPVTGSLTIHSYPFPPSRRQVSTSFLATLGLIASLGLTLSRYSRGWSRSRSRVHPSIRKQGSFAMESLRISMHRSTTLSFRA